MFENITTIDMKILSLYITNYSSGFSIKKITEILNINYPNAFKRVKLLIKKDILSEKKAGKANIISFNINNLTAIHVLSYVEQMKGEELDNLLLFDIVKEVASMDSFACIGIFGSRVLGKAKKHSDWDLFIITDKRREIEKIMSKFPFARDIHLNVFTSDEFYNSLLSDEETVIRHIVKNKHIIYNPYPFYNIISRWEKIRYAKTQ